MIFYLLTPLYVKKDVDNGNHRNGSVIWHRGSGSRENAELDNRRLIQAFVSKQENRWCVNDSGGDSVVSTSTVSETLTL